jgi:hypothetical protein
MARAGYVTGDGAGMTIQKRLSTTVKEAVADGTLQARS